MQIDFIKLNYSYAYQQHLITFNFFFSGMFVVPSGRAFFFYTKKIDSLSSCLLLNGEQVTIYNVKGKKNIIRMAMYVVGVDVVGTNTGESFFLYPTYDFHENIFIDAVL
jgi:hypothetical protein